MGVARKIAILHDVKLDALGDLIEELTGKQLMIAYEFQADVERILARFPSVKVLRGSEKEIEAVLAEWNTGALQLMAVHPASVGHGVNAQLSSASHICWFSATWNLEHWDQLIRRLRRQGSKASHVVNHVLAVRGTIDELKLEALGGKDVSQARLLQVVNVHLSEDNHGTALQTPSRERGTSREVAGVRDSHPGEDPGSSGSRAGGGGRDVWEPGADDGPDEPAPAHGGRAQTSRTSQSGGRHGVPQDLSRAESSAAGEQGGLETMTGLRLPIKGSTPAAEPVSERVGARGWPTKAQPATAPQEAPVAQREAIRARVTPTQPMQAPVEHVEEVEPPARTAARGMFSKAVQAQLAPSEGAEDPNGLDGIESALPAPAEVVQEQSTTFGSPIADAVQKRAPRRKADVPDRETSQPSDALLAHNIPIGNAFPDGQHLTVNLCGSAESVMRIIRAMALA